MYGVYLQRLIVFCVCFLWSGAAHAGAWNQRAGDGQVISTTHWARAEDGSFDDELAAISDFTKLETRVWIEHGLTNNLTVVLNGAVQQISYSDISEDINFEGFDDTEMGVQFQVARKEGLAASIRASYILDGQIDETATTVLSPGDMGEIRFLFGQSRETSSGVIFHDTQLAVRSGNIQRVEQVQGAVTLGYKPTDRWTLMVQGFANHRYKVLNGVERTVVGNTLTELEFFGLEAQSQVTGQISGAWQYKPGRYLQVGARSSLYERNIVDETGIFISLWTEY